MDSEIRGYLTADELLRVKAVELATAYHGCSDKSIETARVLYAFMSNTEGDGDVG